MIEKDTIIQERINHVVTFLMWHHEIAPLRYPAAIFPLPPKETDPVEAMAMVERETEGCQRCRLGKTRTKLVFGTGNVRASIMFIGEGPGEDEDIRGIPFVGRAGQLLTKIIENGMRIPRASVYIANIVKCRPPENREPLADEAAACIGYLKKQISVVKPKVIVLLGKTALKYLLGYEKMSIREAREQTFEYQGIPVFVTYHPSALLRNPAYKPHTWEDIKRVMKFLGLPIPSSK